MSVGKTRTTREIEIKRYSKRSRDTDENMPVENRDAGERKRARIRERLEMFTFSKHSVDGLPSSLVEESGTISSQTRPKPQEPQSKIERGMSNL